MQNANDVVFEYLIDQLRQQVNKKDVTSFNVSVQISDLDDVKQVIHNLQQHIAGKDDEIRALKDSLRDASAQIKELHMALAEATGDVEAYKLIRKGEHGPEQSGCRKEDVQGCEHEWVEFHGLFIAEGDPRNEPGYTFCRKCGLKGYSRKCEHEWVMVTGDGQSFYECDLCGARSKDLPYDLRWLAL